MACHELKNCAVINDLSGFGRCALNISMPVMSALGVRTLPAPTAVLSNHTGFSEYYFSDLTDGMSEYFSAWKKLGLTFDGIYTGFLGSERQVEIISSFIKEAKRGGTLLFVDPVMGDGGSLYTTYTESLVLRMRSLISGADVITPNLTEACFLADVPYADMENATDSELLSLARKLCSLGAKRAVITGIRRGAKVCNYVCDSLLGKTFIVSSKYVGGEFCGAGDIFTSLIAGYMLKGKSFKSAISRASKFLSRAARLSLELHVSPTDGIAFEPILNKI